MVTQRVAVRCIALLVIQQLFMAERKRRQAPESGEAVNNSAALETILVDKVMKLFVQWLLGKRARTGPLRMCIADRSTILTILSSGAGRAFIRIESSDEEPVGGLKQ